MSSGDHWFIHSLNITIFSCISAIYTKVSVQADRLTIQLINMWFWYNQPPMHTKLPSKDETCNNKKQRCSSNLQISVTVFVNSFLKNQSFRFSVRPSPYEHFFLKKWKKNKCIKFQYCYISMISDCRKKWFMPTCADCQPFLMKCKSFSGKQKAQSNLLTYCFVFNRGKMVILH